MSASTVRVGILGAGRFAQFMASEMRRCDGLEVVAVASTSARRAAEIAGARHVADYAALVDAEDVDCVYNALSNDLHMPWTVAALAQGKPVLCEKPLGVDAAEAALMHDAAEAADVPLMEAYWHLFHPRFALVRDLIAAGAVGDVIHVNAGFAHDMDFTGNFREQPALGGGMLLDIGCYPLSTILWLRASAHVTAATVLSMTRNDHGADMHAECSVTLSDGLTATIVASAQRPPRRWFEVIGTEGTLRCDEPAFSHHPEHADGTGVWLDADGEVQQWRVPAADPRRVMLEHWHDVVRRQTSPALDSKLSVRTAHGLDVMRAG